MGFPAGVLQVQRCEQDLNAPQFVLLGFVQSRQCNQRHKNNHLCKQLWICECFCIKTTTDFAERLSNRTVDDNEVLVSYDVSSLFTEVPLDETIDYIIHEIYTIQPLFTLGSVYSTSASEAEQTTETNNSNIT